jgi:isocitrate dehydrogenase (NAD+)
MMLNELGDRDGAQRVRQALIDTIRSQGVLTRDMGGTATTEEFTDAVIERLG